MYGICVEIRYAAKSDNGTFSIPCFPLPFFVYHLTTLNSCYVRHLPAKHDVRATRSSRCIEETSRRFVPRLRTSNARGISMYVRTRVLDPGLSDLHCIFYAGRICTFDERVSSFFYAPESSFYYRLSYYHPYFVLLKEKEREKETL